MPFLYYLVFLAVLASGFVANAFLHGGKAPTVAAVGRVTTETTPLEKLQREISIRRGVIPPPQEEHAETSISPAGPIPAQTETAAVTTGRVVAGESSVVEDANSGSAQFTTVQPELATPVKPVRAKQAAKCGAGGCGATQARSVWSDADRTP